MQIDYLALCYRDVVLNGRDISPIPLLRIRYIVLCTIACMAWLSDTASMNNDNTSHDVLPEICNALYLLQSSVNVHSLLLLPQP